MMTLDQEKAKDYWLNFHKPEDAIRYIEYQLTEIEVDKRKLTRAQLVALTEIRHAIECLNLD